MQDAMLPGTELEVLDVLGGSQRSVVRRVRVGSGTLILKEYRQPGDGWVRESAALSVMPRGAPAPRLVAERATPPAVAMSDAGPGGSVADALLGDDPVRASAAVVAWATAIGTMHRVTTGLREPFRQALTARNGYRPVAESAVVTRLDTVARNMARHCAELGIDVPPDAFAQLRALAVRLDGAGAAALTPADACPDNNVFTGDGLVLIDFEGAEWRHVAWDVAYLTVPWPSCWCSWRIPRSVAEQATHAYRAAAALPYVDSPAFDADVAAAAAGWAFVSASWFLPQALHDNASLAAAGPTRRALILHRMRQAAGSAELPALAALAGRMHKALTGRWGEVPLDCAPAFAERAEGCGA